ncbi:MAG: hypothetical protein AB7I42_24205 [Bradyrhizobium sp.]|uniref:hypothetical protein n=1 Tax=Bradyrhizobium sp. TaxID=376 RepID=UPI003D126750
MASTKASYHPDGTARYWVDGKECSRAEYDAATPSKLASFADAQAAEIRKNKGWPMDSIGLGCHPKEIRKYQRLYAKHGINAQFNKRGFLRCENQQDYNRKAEVVRHWHGDYGPSKDYNNPEKRAWRKA